jgi:3-methyladenine DNA glycosylase Mpg
MARRGLRALAAQAIAHEQTFGAPAADLARSVLPTDRGNETRQEVAMTTTEPGYFTAYSSLSMRMPRCSITSLTSRSMPTHEDKDLIGQQAGYRIGVQPDRHIGWRAR